MEYCIDFSLVQGGDELDSRRFNVGESCSLSLLFWIGPPTLTA